MLGNAAKRAAFAVGLLAEGLVDDESPAGEPSRRTQGLPEVDRPPPIQRQLPGGRRPGNADGESTRDGFGEGNRQAVLDEGVRAHARRRGFPPIDRADPAGAGVVVHEEPATADSGAVGLGDAQGSRRGDGGIDRIAAAFQDIQADLGRVRVDRRHGATVADGNRVLRRSLRRGGGRWCDQHDGREGRQCRGKKLGT